MGLSSTYNLVQVKNNRKNLLKRRSLTKSFTNNLVSALLAVIPNDDCMTVRNAFPKITIESVEAVYHETSRICNKMAHTSDSSTKI